MKVAIFSDLHDTLPNLNIFLAWVASHKIPKLIFCGDLTHQETLEHLIHNFKGEIFMVSGNADSYNPAGLKNIVYHKDRLEIKIDNQKILVTHRPADLKKILADNNSFDFAFHGHTHRPWLTQQDGLIIANPGTLSEIFSKSSFALLDTETGKLELKILKTV